MGGDEIADFRPGEVHGGFATNVCSDEIASGEKDQYYGLIRDVIALHQVGFVHRDVKRGNMVIGINERDCRPFL
ncbi:unnamed protein product [Onchocerca flexuosa]|uniref:Protein kinase domain-containing protein n=1 Tax=Onchocerca flexuosa TaxID=387005 RepID=A0A183I4T9_9BILA|nr:unnamed protein product [Onchocerca flexuosa]